ncbi:MAG: hypothetical protein D6736_15940 [Nitrospinota bacterium]|nr:MAG: hypothetical protein D6736_15940 [Nitrospinota bacterium]
MEATPADGIQLIFQREPLTHAWMNFQSSHVPLLKRRHWAYEGLPLIEITHTVRVASHLQPLFWLGQSVEGGAEKRFLIFQNAEGNYVVGGEVTLGDHLAGHIRPSVITLPLSANGTRQPISEKGYLTFEAEVRERTLGHLRREIVVRTGVGKSMEPDFILQKSLQSWVYGEKYWVYKQEEALGRIERNGFTDKLRFRSFLFLSAQPEVWERACVLSLFVPTLMDSRVRLKHLVQDLAAPVGVFVVATLLHSIAAGLGISPFSSQRFGTLMTILYGLGTRRPLRAIVALAGGGGRILPGTLHQSGRAGLYIW